MAEGGGVEETRRAVLKIADFGLSNVMEDGYLWNSMSKLHSSRRGRGGGRAGGGTDPITYVIQGRGMVTWAEMEAHLDDRGVHVTAMVGCNNHRGRCFRNPIHFLPMPANTTDQLFNVNENPCCPADQEEDHVGSSKQHSYVPLVRFGLD